MHVAFALLLVLGMALHTLRATRLVDKRTAELSAALEREKAFQAQAQAANERLARIEKVSAVGQLSSIFAHEMRQPLGAISLYAYGLKKRVAAGRIEPHVFGETLEKLVDQAGRASRIVERVRAYAKSEAGKPEPVDLVQAVERAVSDLKASGRANAAIVFERPSAPTIVVMDALDLELVVLNLLKNALDAVKPFGAAGCVRVHIRTETRAQGARYATIAVEDNGYPLSQAAFESLSDLHPSTKTEGLGLGLAIVRGILERYAGRLAFERRERGGLIATVRLPLASSDANSIEVNEADPSQEKSANGALS